MKRERPRPSLTLVSAARASESALPLCPPRALFSSQLTHHVPAREGCRLPQAAVQAGEQGASSEGECPAPNLFGGGGRWGCGGGRTAGRGARGRALSAPPPLAAPVRRLRGRARAPVRSPGRSGPRIPPVGAGQRQTPPAREARHFFPFALHEASRVRLRTAVCAHAQPALPHRRLALWRSISWRGSPAPEACRAPVARTAPRPIEGRPSRLPSPPLAPARLSHAPPRPPSTPPILRSASTAPPRTRPGRPSPTASSSACPARACTGRWACTCRSSGPPRSTPGRTTSWR